MTTKEEINTKIPSPMEELSDSTHLLHAIFAKIFIQPNENQTNQKTETTDDVFISEIDPYFTNLLQQNDYFTVNEIMQAPSVLSITTNPEIIRSAIISYKGFYVNNDIVRPLISRPEQTTIILRDISSSLPTEDIINIFQAENVQCPKPLTARSDMNDTWFVSFATETEAKQALIAIKSITFQEKSIRARLKTESATAAYYSASPSPSLPDSVQKGSTAPSPMYGRPSSNPSPSLYYPFIPPPPPAPFLSTPPYPPMPPMPHGFPTVPPPPPNGSMYLNDFQTTFPAPPPPPLMMPYPGVDMSDYTASYIARNNRYNHRNTYHNNNNNNQYNNSNNNGNGKGNVDTAPASAAAGGGEEYQQRKPRAQSEGGGNTVTSSNGNGNGYNQYANGEYTSNNRRFYNNYNQQQQNNNNTTRYRQYNNITGYHMKEQHRQYYNGNQSQASPSYYYYQNQGQGQGQGGYNNKERKNWSSISGESIDDEMFYQQPDVDAVTVVTSSTSNTTTEHSLDPVQLHLSKEMMAESTSWEGGSPKERVPSCITEISNGNNNSNKEEGLKKGVTGSSIGGHHINNDETSCDADKNVVKDNSDNLLLESNENTRMISHNNTRSNKKAESTEQNTMKEKERRDRGSRDRTQRDGGDKTFSSSISSKAKKEKGGKMQHDHQQQQPLPPPQPQVSLSLEADFPVLLQQQSLKVGLVVEKKGIVAAGFDYAKAAKKASLSSFTHPSNPSLPVISSTITNVENDNVSTTSSSQPDPIAITSTTDIKPNNPTTKHNNISFGIVSVKPAPTVPATVGTAAAAVPAAANVTNGKVHHHHYVDDGGKGQGKEKESSNIVNINDDNHVNEFMPLSFGAFTTLKVTTSSIPSAATATASSNNTIESKDTTATTINTTSNEAMSFPALSHHRTDVVPSSSSSADAAIPVVASNGKKSFSEVLRQSKK